MEGLEARREEGRAAYTGLLEELLVGAGAEEGVGANRGGARLEDWGWREGAGGREGRDGGGGKMGREGGDGREGRVLAAEGGEEQERGTD